MVCGDVIVCVPACISPNISRQLDINKPVLKVLDMDECAMFHLMLEDAQNLGINEGYMISLATEHGQVCRSPSNCWQCWFN